MRRQLLSIPVAFIAFALSLLIAPYDPSSGIRGVINGVVSVLNQSDNLRNRRIPGQYSDCWGGINGGVIDLNDRFITDVEQGNSYQYRIVSHSSDGRYYLLELLDFRGNSNLRKYVHLGFEDNGSMNYFGYDSMDDYYYGRASASGGFKRNYCMNLH